MSEDYNSLATSNDEQTEAVDQSTNPNDFEIVDINPESSEDQPEIVDQDVVEPEETEEVAPKKQTREENHAAKAARLKAERDAKAQVEQARKEAHDEFERRFKAAGVKNPYTEKAFESLDEYEAYGKRLTEAEQRDRAEAEGKTIEEIQQEDEDKAYIARKRQEDSEKADKERANARLKEKVENDRIAFEERYPDVDVSQVLTNESFVKFVGSRWNTDNLADLYGDFVDLVGTAENNGRAKANRTSRSTGSGDTGGDRMTATQRAELEAWNSAYPEMAMSPAEFLKRG